MFYYNYKPNLRGSPSVTQQLATQTTPAPAPEMVDAKKQAQMQPQPPQRPASEVVKKQAIPPARQHGGFSWRTEQPSGHKYR